MTVPWSSDRNFPLLVAAFALLFASCSLAFAPHHEFDSTALLRRQNSTLEGCLGAAGIETSLPSSADWVNDTLAWNSRLSPVPAAVVFPKSEAEVTTILKCASDANVKVTTLGGNRSFASMGFGRNDGALIINLRNMKVLSFDTNTQQVTLGGPVMISEAAGFLWNSYSRALPHGRCPDVGMTGVGMGGGFGTLSRKSGTVLDNIVAMRVALANGTIVDTSLTENTDLFWGLRGAGNSLGVVLTMSIQTLSPATTVTNYTISFPSGITPTIEQNAAALFGAQNWAQSVDNDDDLSIRFALRTSSTLAGFYYGDQSNFQAVAESLLSYLPNMTVKSNQFNFWDSEDITTPGIIAQTITARRYFYITSVTIPSSKPLTQELAIELFNKTVYQTKPTDASVSGFVDIWGGDYTNAVQAADSAWKHDGNLLLVRWDIRTSSFDTAFSTETLDTVRGSFYEFVETYKAAGGVPGGFPNYRDANWNINETAEYLYGSNWDKLLEVKKEYDPAGLLNTDPQAVPVY
ncbi:uncharacterized protein BCR38DRAFT_392949 [Pseudomassariella vexata]|uniref:FAD-binding PCMH-type domain-containing protein n=1 Tax=Pseudomassariella vexata TaxID=1141098 RepID=A0A1Y2DYB4_9PEZI|nr:uncharacterized protein BCR38DRAFT_392949 [Pseudomassariella vexata]ORY64298.1 hypothetical protein BCR38DRAFT_392949 [Pseudomassariella vexata]